MVETRQFTGYTTLRVVSLRSTIFCEFETQLSLPIFLLSFQSSEKLFHAITKANSNIKFLSLFSILLAGHIMSTTLDNEVGRDRQHAATITSTVCVVIAAIFVVLRITARKMRGMRIGLDDWIEILSLVCLTNITTRFIYSPFRRHCLQVFLPLTYFVCSPRVHHCCLVLFS